LDSRYVQGIFGAVSSYISLKFLTTDDTLKRKMLILRRILLILAGIGLSGFFLIYIADIRFTQSYPEFTEQGKMAFMKSEPAHPEEKNNLSGWTMVFEDDFNTGEVDLTKWNRMDRKLNPNHELQYYDPMNTSVSNGNLMLTAKKEQTGGKDYTSAMVGTRNKFSFKRGKVEVRLKLPGGRGLFPAVWLLPQNDQGNYHEIDLLEVLGDDPRTIYAVSHFISGGRKEKVYGQTEITRPDEFHVFCVIWDEDSIRWYADERLYFTTVQEVPDEDMYLIMNLAVGGDWPGNPDAATPFPSSLVVDYIRVYQKV
jgi:beta-glucanase (GH16 family)